MKKLILLIAKDNYSLDVKDILIRDYLSSRLGWIDMYVTEFITKNLIGCSFYLYETFVPEDLDI